jgi:adenylate kinase family enzyme
MAWLSCNDELPYRPAGILVAGSSGSGKSTLARHLAAVLELRYVELDALHHGTNWTPRPEFLEEVTRFAAGQRWVTEWQYRAVRDLLAERADLLISLDLPRRLVMRRVARRTLSRRLRHVKLWNGNVEPPLRTIMSDRDHIIRWAWRTHNDHAPRVTECAERHPTLPVVRLRTPDQIKDWLAGPLTRAACDRCCATGQPENVARPASEAFCSVARQASKGRCRFDRSPQPEREALPQASAPSTSTSLGLVQPAVSDGGDWSQLGATAAPESLRRPPRSRAPDCQHPRHGRHHRASLRLAASNDLPLPDLSRRRRCHSHHCRSIIQYISSAPRGDSTTHHASFQVASMPRPQAHASTFRGSRPRASPCPLPRRQALPNACAQGATATTSPRDRSRNRAIRAARTHTRSEHTSRPAVRTRSQSQDQETAPGSARFLELGILATIASLRFGPVRPLIRRSGRDRRIVAHGAAIDSLLLRWLVGRERRSPARRVTARDTAQDSVTAVSPGGGS